MIPVGLTIIMLSILVLLVRICVSRELPTPMRVALFICTTAALYLMIYWNTSLKWRLEYGHGT